MIFRATEQWFIAMEGEADAARADTLRSRALEEIQKVKWDPAWGEERISNMIATRPDWCISRQRIWGVPIAVFHCEGCKEFLNDEAVTSRRGRVCSRREGTDAWYKRSAEEILPAGTKCAKCGGAKFRKEMDIIDVWFESGSQQAAVLGHEPDFPGLPISTSRAATSIADGSTLPCCAPSALTEQLPYRGVATAVGRSMTGPRTVEVAGQHC